MAKLQSTEVETKLSQTKRQFMEVWPILKGQLVDLLKAHRMPDEVTTWFSENLSYNIVHGKLNRGLAVVETLEILHNRALTPDELFKGCVLGWCVEILQVNVSLAKDMMANSFRVPSAKQTGTNDGFMLEAALYHLLKLYFRTEPCYVYLLELFLGTTFQTATGQMIDILTFTKGEINLDKLSLERYQQVTIYKTAYHSFYLPVALAMRYAGIYTDSAYATALSILIPMGVYFQVQTDYLDTPRQTESVDADQKCSWDITIALRHANEEQRKALEEHYGHKEAASEAQVNQIFNDLQIDGLYKEYEQTTYEHLSNLINVIPEVSQNCKEGIVYEDRVTLKKRVFSSLLDRIYQRQ
ncbi:hypothetical protein M408DRAFT_15949 [Serendipita vermifera MAFF 305830]|uniref:Farnesyl pyrophosphate synthase n=1 Tax=Serendipita vermifera MAFF 305830 TaxID=933852 RepID=A0A0C3BCP6_SERVB|nr:hypothetical protein M408DRAFT_15949 [Serendipita vermifera MAFF 305830]